MTKKKQKPSSAVPVKRAYELSLVHEEVERNHFVVSKRAFKTAREDFEWEREEIRCALLKLRRKDWCGTLQSQDVPGVLLDEYACEDLLGESVYVHFRIDPYDGVVVDSCKKNNEVGRGI